MADSDQLGSYDDSESEFSLLPGPRAGPGSIVTQSADSESDSDSADPGAGGRL
jgi:hypothetical protein